MNRLGLIIGLAVVILAGALGYFWIERAQPGAPESAQLDLATSPEPLAAPKPEPAPSPAAPEAQATPAPSKPATQAPATVTQAVIAETKKAEPESQQSARKPPQPAPIVEATKASPVTKPEVKNRKVAPPRDPGPVAVLPSFDVVRIEPSGETVVAGRATPGSSVVLIDGKRILAEVTANEKGEWVIVLRVPLAPGAHELSLESRQTSGEVLLSENVVVVNVPAPAPAQVAETQPPPAAAPASVPKAQASEATAPTSQATAPTSQAMAPTSAAPESVGASASVAVPIETLRPLAVLMARSGAGPIRIIQAPEPVPRGLGDKALLLETVDYDEHGRAVIGGRGAAGAVLLLYLDGRPAGRTAVGADGRWRAQLDGEVPFGVHSLRIDQINESGKVVARVESPFSRANLLAATGDEMAVIVQPGNSLWRIARRVYGEGVRYSVIYAANQSQIGDPNLIFPGQIFVVPVRN